VPELPDLTVYLEALQARIVGARLEDVQLASPFLLRTVTPPLDAVRGRTVLELRRVGKRLAIGLDGGVWLVLHLMIAGRLHWFARGASRGRRAALARFEFSSGTLTLTEAGSKRRASLHLVAGEAGLQAQDPGGLELQSATLAQFAARLRSANHTLKRALTDPRLFSGVGNAYGDEILHAARLSPFKMADKLNDDELVRLFDAMRAELTDALQRQVGQKAATMKGEKRSGLQVHARTGLPCPVCGDTVREVSFADTSLQYCPTCQTGGKPLADRRLSKLLR